MSSTFCMIAMFYIMAGHLANQRYDVRDIFLTNKVDGLIYANYNKRSEYMIKEEEAAKSAGWFFWRRKKPFKVLPYFVKDLIGIIFWPIDLLLTEIGYRRELRYLECRQN